MKWGKKKLESLLIQAKHKYNQASIAQNALFLYLYKIGILPDEIPSHAENADNLADAITCFIAYGEYSIDDIISEVEDSIAKMRGVHQ